jgi:transposase-like protein
MSSKKNHSPNFKAKVAAEAIKGELTTAEISAKYGVHQTQIARWKKQALENLPGIFEGKILSSKNRDDAEKDELYKEIGKMKVKLDFFQTRSGL